VKGLVDLSRQGTRNVGFSVPSLDLLVAHIVGPEREARPVAMWTRCGYAGKDGLK